MTLWVSLKKNNYLKEKFNYLNFNQSDKKKKKKVKRLYEIAKVYEYIISKFVEVKQIHEKALSYA
jgi:hypothetical protein